MVLLKKILPLLIAVSAMHAAAQTGADSVLNFIAKNKNRSSLYVAVNGERLCSQNDNKLMPLASTVKILVAVEFAKQAGNNVIDENSRIPLSELNKYYIPDTDGGAHPEWINYEKFKKHIVNDSVKLVDVARGMIMFSSNANTEYLMDLLGLDNIKNNIQLFGLTEHTAVFPLVASLFLYQNPKHLGEGKILKAIEKMKEEEYCKTILQIHQALKYDTLLKSRFRLEDLSMKMQKEWSDRLPASSAKSYVQLCSILNRRKYLDENSYAVLAEVLEFFMESPMNKKIYKHFGIKNGSTGFVLTEAFYASTQKGDMIEAAYFFNNLTEKEIEQLTNWLNDVRIGLTQNESFRKKAAAMFGNNN
jgi:D-alanyl-D-alanine carboxypeptidase